MKPQQSVPTLQQRVMTIYKMIQKKNIDSFICSDSHGPYIKAFLPEDALREIGLTIPTSIHPCTQDVTLKVDYAWIEAADRTVPSDFTVYSKIHHKIMTAVNECESNGDCFATIKIDLSDFDNDGKLKDKQKVLAIKFLVKY